jgi:hypothetical protein
VTGIESVQKAGFVLTESPAFVGLSSGERLRAASVMKPLLFWAASSLPPFVEDSARWIRLAQAAVTVSDNNATVEAWEACGGRALLDELTQRTAVGFSVQPGGVREFGRVLVDAGGMACAYATLAGSQDPAADRVIGWMREVGESQTFGLRVLVGSRLLTDSLEVGVKCGWSHDDDEEWIRTHAVTVTRCDLGHVGTCVLTALPMTDADRDAYAAAAGRDDEELRLHERIAGEVLRGATAEVLRELGF